MKKIDFHSTEGHERCDKCKTELLHAYYINLSMWWCPICEMLLIEDR